jgi:allantoicase
VCDLSGDPPPAALAKAAWVEALPRFALAPSARNVQAVGFDAPGTHVRLNIHPDGGVARLRVYGEVLVDWSRLRGKVVELSALGSGGQVLAASDEHFGAKGNLILPGRAPNMGEGWETRRRRGPGHDWAILRLGAAGTIERIEIDTNHFKGNYPESASLEACRAERATLKKLASDDAWTGVLARTPLRPSARHFFAKEIQAAGPFTHVRLRIYPDGGISRLRIHGRAVAP